MSPHRFTRTVLPAGRALLVAGAAAALVYGASSTGRTFALGEAVDQAVLPQSSARPVTETLLACPGPERLGVQGLRSVVGTTSITAAAAPTPSLTPALGTGAPATGGAVGIRVGAAAPATGAAVADRETVATAPVAQDQAAFVRADGALAPGAAATQSWVHAGDDDRGLALAPCLAPAAQLWLVAGGAGASRTERLILANPGSNSVQASLSVSGADGPVAAATGRPVTVPPHGRTVLSVDALAPGEASPAVHVTAAGGQLAGWLGDAWIEGATARGVDTSAPATAPDTSLTLVAPLSAGGTLRLVNPGEREALARVSVVTSEASSAVPTLRAVRVPAGASVDAVVPPTADARGLRVGSDLPLTGAVLTQSIEAQGQDREGDIAWTPATAALGPLGGATVPAVPGTSAQLLLVGGERETTATVHLGTARQSTPHVVTLPAGGSASVPLSGTNRVWVQAEPDTAVRATLVLSGTADGAPVLATRPLYPAALTVTTVPIRHVTR